MNESEMLHSEVEEPFISNASTLTQFYKKPLINTTYISYIDDNPIKRPQTSTPKFEKGRRKTPQLYLEKRTVNTIV